MYHWETFPQSLRNLETCATLGAYCFLSIRKLISKIVKKGFLVLLLFILTGFVRLSAQQNRMTQFVAGMDVANYSHSGDHKNETFFFGVNKTWNKKSPERVSWAKSAGIAIKYYSLDRESGGLGAFTNYSGEYIFSTINLSLHAQLRFRRNYYVQIGPRVEYLLAGLEHLSSESGTVLTDLPTMSSEKVVEFNRNYFRQPYFGPDLKLMLQNPGDAASVGLNFSYMLTFKDDSNFDTGGLFRIAFLMEL